MTFQTSKRHLILFLGFISSPFLCSSFTVGTSPSLALVGPLSTSSRRNTNQNGRRLTKNLERSSFGVPCNLCMSSDSDDNNYGDDTTATSNTFSSSSITNRFTSPILDDRGLPFADTYVSQIIGPALQLYWLFHTNSVLPSWVHSNLESSALWESQASLMAQTLIHGSGLACCWIVGALATGAYERKAFDLNASSHGTVFGKALQAGVFATGVLLFATQMDLLSHPGEVSDMRVLTAFMEGANDVIFEAIAILSWRMVRASMTRLRPNA